MTTSTVPVKTDVPLKLSVITSSGGDDSISKLFTELWTLRTYSLDFYPRGTDIKDAYGIKSLEELEKKSLLDRFAELDIDKLVDYTKEQKKIASRNI